MEEGDYPKIDHLDNNESKTDCAEIRACLKLQDTRSITEFKSHQLENNSRKYWDLFYKRNEDRFFKDRQWTTREFKELIAIPQSRADTVSDDRIHTRTETKFILEVGCGVGNFLYPFLSQSRSHIGDGNDYFVYACDFSPRAIELLKSNKLYDERKVQAFVADVTNKESLLQEQVPQNQLDFVTLIFVLSAIHPKHYDAVLQNLYQLLKPNGVILFRDYGCGDMTQLRFKAASKIFDNFYARQDGTRSFFFSVDFVRNLFIRNNFDEIETTNVHRRTINVKEGIDVARIFVQAKYVKRGELR